METPILALAPVVWIMMAFRSDLTSEAQMFNQSSRKQHQINTEDPWVSTLCLNQPNTDVSALSLCIFRKSLLLYIFNIWVTWKQRLASIFDRCPLLSHLWVRQDPGIPDWDEYITSVLKELFMTSASGQLTTAMKQRTDPPLFSSWPKK